MSKFINVKVSAIISTDFFIEVPDNATEEKIKELAEKEVILPHTYPTVIDNVLKTRMGINVQGLDSMLKDWTIDKIEYTIDGGDADTSERE